MLGSFSVSTPVTSAAKPTKMNRAARVHHSGERVVNSLIRSTASRVMGSLPGSGEVGGGRHGAVGDFGVVLDRVAGELDEGLLERAALRAQLVQYDVLLGGQLADLGDVHGGDDETVALVADGRAVLT